MPPVESPSILLVDHSDYLSDRLGEGLASSGFEIYRVNSAADCLDLLEANEIRGIISRHRLPDLNGIRLLRSVRVTHPNLPFVLAPENGSEKIASEAIDAGVSRYIADDDDAGSALDHVADSVRESGAMAPPQYP